MRTGLGRGLVIAIITLGAGLGPVRADPPVNPPMQDPWYGPPHHLGVGSGSVWAPVPEPTAPKQTHPVRDCLRNLNFTCWAHHNQLTCGSLVSELRFAFGSCRAWYGEQCPASPPAVPAPAGYPASIFGPGYAPGSGATCPNCH